MAFFQHLLLAVAYAAIAAAVALVLPLLVPSIGAVTGVMAGGMVLLASALLHEVFARQEDYARFAEAVDAVNLDRDKVLRELRSARAEVANIHGAIAEAAARREGAASQEALSEVQAEVKILQGLIAHFPRPDGASEIFPAPAMGDEAGTSPVTTSSTSAAPAETETPVGAPADLDDLAPDLARDLSPDEDDAPALPVISGDLDDATILDIVQDGLRSDRVDLVLQPVVRLPQRKRGFYEAFTRIRSADGMTITPEQYIGIAEREGLVTAIDNMLLFRCVQLVRKTRRHNRDYGFFCNISAHTMADQVFFRDFIDFMSDNKDLSESLIFEFNQATFANADIELERHLSRLAAMGFRFSIDQVSTLHLDYQALIKRRVKFVKIDAKTMLAEIAAESAAAFAELKRALDRSGIDLIVEKIESESMLVELLDHRIDFGQGYLFGEPRLSRAA